MALLYDPAKAAANFRKHGISFADAEGVLFDPLALTIEDTNSVGEQRFISLGVGSTGELLVVVYAKREEDFRLISARRATAQERKRYES